MSDSTDSKLGGALQSLVWRIVVEGTPVESYEAGRGGFTRYGAPWFVIDRAQAEPDVSWPGRLVGQADDPIEASKIQVAEIGRLAREELKLTSASQ